jgi:hypothetical protein
MPKEIKSTRAFNRVKAIQEGRTNPALDPDDPEFNKFLYGLDRFEIHRGGGLAHSQRLYVAFCYGRQIEAENKKATS